MDHNNYFQNTALNKLIRADPFYPVCTAACYDMDYLENDTYIECAQCSHRSYVCSFSLFFFDEYGKGCIGLSIKEYNCNSLHLHECNAHLANRLSSHDHKANQQTQSTHIVSVSWTLRC